MFLKPLYPAHPAIHSAGGTVTSTCGILEVCCTAIFDYYSVEGCPPPPSYPASAALPRMPRTAHINNQ